MSTIRRPSLAWGSATAATIGLVFTPPAQMTVLAVSSVPSFVRSERSPTSDTSVRSMMRTPSCSSRRCAIAESRGSMPGTTRSAPSMSVIEGSWRTSMLG